MHRIPSGTRQTGEPWPGEAFSGWVALMVMPFHDIYNAFMGVTQAELTIITYPTPPATDPLEPFSTPSLSDI